MLELAYFCTMMVHLGLASGMVSGAAHTTADTIRPALEFIGTRPGVRNVSSVFFMLFSDRVLVYGDFAVMPVPTAEQLVDIAVASADTASRFGVEPRVAMLSYSTGASGTGISVDLVPKPPNRSGLPVRIWLWTVLCTTMRQWIRPLPDLKWRHRLLPDKPRC